LKRPISPATANLENSKKRHQVYLKDKEMQKKLLQSDNMLQHYMTQIERKEPRTVLGDLESQNIYQP
jgi:ABC-type Fe3+-citrate transport system substrate-binding protein